MKSKWLSRFIVGSMICGLASLAVVGCVTETKYVTVDGQPIPTVSSDYKAALKHLPPGATNVVEMGNRYFTYELEGNKFMFTYWYGSHGEIAKVSTPLTKPCNCGTMCETKETKRGDGPGLVE